MSFGLNLGTLGRLGGAAIGFGLGGPAGAAAGYAGGGYLGDHLGGGGGPAAPSELDQYTAALRKQQQDAYAQQQALAQHLNDVIHGKAPSVAGMQLGAGLESINRGEASQAAGVGGEGGVLARYAAMNGAATAGAAANTAGALARTTEEANATQNLGNVLSSEGTDAANVYGTNISGGNAAAANQITKTKNEEDFGTKLLGAGLSAGGQAGATKALSGA